MNTEKNNVGELPENFHRHPNGGGLVENSAQVDETAFVGENAVVGDYAQVKENARICGEAKILDHAVIGGSAEVFGSAKILGSSEISEQARVSGSAKIDGGVICGDAWIKGEAEINGKAYVEGAEWSKSPLYYSREKLVSTDEGYKLKTCSITHSKAGYTAINCQSRPHEFWLSKEGEKFLKEWGFSDLTGEIQKCVRTIQKAERKELALAAARRSILNVTQKVTQKLGMRMG